MQQARKESSASRLRKIYAQYVEDRERQGLAKGPVNLNDVYEFAFNVGWREPKSDPRSRFRKYLARALAEDHFTDMKDRTIRRYHARKRVYIDDHGIYVQEVLWDDMLSDPPPERAFMEASFKQRRNQVGGELHQLKNDLDHYNDKLSDEEPIKMLWDFTNDMRDQDQPTEYAVPPMED
jgi:hypothetical protein